MIAYRGISVGAAQDHRYFRFPPVLALGLSLQFLQLGVALLLLTLPLVLGLVSDFELAFRARFDSVDHDLPLSALMDLFEL